MTGSDLQWGEENVPVLALNESVDPRVLPPGMLSEVINVDYTARDGSVRKRPGTQLAMDAMVTANANKLVVHQPKKQLLVADLEGSSSTAPALYGALDAPDDGNSAHVERHVGNAPNVVVRRQPVMTDLQSNIVADSAYVNTPNDFGYMVYGTVHVQSGNWIVKVVQVPKNGEAYEPGNTVLETNIAYSREDGTAVWVRCAPAQDKYVLVTAMLDTGAAVNIRGVVVDCSATTVPTIGAITVIVNGVTGFTGINTTVGNDVAESTYDTDLGSGTPNWLVSWLAGSSDVTVRRLYSTSLTTGWTQTIAGCYAARAISCYEYGGVTWLNWYSGLAENEIITYSWYYAALATATGAVTLAKTVWCAAADVGSADINAEGWVSGICFHEVANQAILFHSQDFAPVVGPTGVPGFDDRSLVRWRVVDTAAAMTAIYQKRGPWLLSKPWKDRNNGFYLAWCGYDNISYQDPLVSTTGSSPALAKFDMTAVLMRFAEPPSARSNYVPAASPTAQAIATTAGYTLAEPLSALYTNYVYAPLRQAQVPRSVSHGTAANSAVAVEKLGRRCCINVRYIQTELQSGPWDVCVRDTESADFRAGYGRYQTALFGQSTYGAGGLLTQWDGDRHHEDNYISQPTIRIDCVTTGSSDWPVAWAEKLIHFQVVWESVSAGGERTKSATSALASITLGGDVALGTAPTDTLTLYIEPNTVTSRSYGSGQTTQTPRTIAVLYASATPGGDDLHRIGEFSNDGSPTLWNNYVCEPDALVPITITVTGPWDNSELELIYNDSGELDNDPPYGGCSTLAVHKDRLWVGGGDEPDLLWYSKERADGRTAEFAFGQQVRIAGQEVVALASLDDALIVLCKNGVYAIYGDGPNATGDAASGFYQVVPISTSVGCLSPAVAVIPKGVIFQAPSGMMLLNRGRALEPMPHVNTSATARPVKSTAIVQQLSQARFVLANTPALVEAGTVNADVLVYDWEADRWATWRYSLNSHSLEPPAGLIVDIAVIDDRIYILTDDGRVLREDSTLGGDCNGTVGVTSYPYRQRLKFGWIDFGRPQGYKRIRHWLGLFNPNPWASYTADPTLFPFGLKATFDFNHADSGTSLERWWVNYELGGIAPWDGITKTRCHLSKKQPAIRLTLDEDEPIRRLVATDTAASVAVGANTVLYVQLASAGPYIPLTVTGGTRTKVQIAADLNTAIVAAGGEGYLLASVDGSNRIVLQVTAKDETGYKGSYLAVDSVANGSTLNSVIGFAVGGVTGSLTVAAASQTGFVLQGQTYEVGQAAGTRRTPAAQSK